MAEFKIPASIEISPKQANESKVLPGLFPEGTRVYMTDIGTDPTDYLVSGAKRIRDLGYEPVPHFASRRMISRDILDDRVHQMTDKAAVSDVLVIGGGLEKQAGEFASTMEVLETGVFEQYGITHMGVAGHPEGSPDFNDEIAIQVLHEKQAFSEKSGINVRIVTQFGFDGNGFLKWAAALKEQGITMPIHLGVAGPAKVTTLIKFAAMCGVGNSLNFLKKRGSAIVTMATGFDPDEVAGPLETHWQSVGNNSDIEQLHVFPFGGLKKSSQWLNERGSWNNLSQKDE